MKMMLTKSGKIHRVNDNGNAVCTVNKKSGAAKRRIVFESEVTELASTGYDDDKFCAKCFHGNKIDVQIEVAPQVETVAQAQAQASPAETMAQAQANKLTPIDGNGLTSLDAIQAMINKLEAFSNDKENTQYKRFKASYYVESFYAIRDMLKTGNVEEINRIILRLI